MALNSDQHRDGLTYIPWQGDVGQIVMADDGRLYSKNLLKEFFDLIPGDTQLYSPITGNPMSRQIRELSPELHDRIKTHLETSDASRFSNLERTESGPEHTSVDGGHTDVMPRAVHILLNSGFGDLLPTEDLIPSIVSVGPENVGKSLMLQRLIGIPLFPVANDLTTRMAIVVRLRHGQAKLPRVYVRKTKSEEIVPVKCKAYTGPCAGDTQVLKDDVVPVTFLPKAIKDRMDRIMNELRDEAGRPLRVDLEHEIVVELQSPLYFNADIVDLPGIIQAEGHLLANRPQDTRKLVERFIDIYREKGLFLVTSRATTPANQNPAINCLHDKHLEHLGIGVITHCDKYHSDYANYASNGFIKLSHGWTGLAVGLGEEVTVIGPSKFAEMRAVEDACILTLPRPEVGREFFHNPGIASLRKSVQRGLQFFYAHVVVGRIVHGLEDKKQKTLEDVAVLGIPFVCSDGYARGRGQPAAIVRAVVYKRAVEILGEKQPGFVAAIDEAIQTLLQPFHELHDKIVKECAEFSDDKPLSAGRRRHLAERLFGWIREELEKLEENLVKQKQVASTVASLIKSALTKDDSTVKLARFNAFIETVVTRALEILSDKFDTALVNCARSCIERRFAHSSQVFQFHDGRLVYKLSSGPNTNTLPELVEYELAEALMNPLPELITSILPSIDTVNIDEDTSTLEQREKDLRHACRLEDCIRALEELRREVFLEDVEKYSIQNGGLEQRNCQSLVIDTSSGNAEKLLEAATYSPELTELTIKHALSHPLQKLQNCITIQNNFRHLRFEKVIFSVNELRSLIDTIGSNISISTLEFNHCSLKSEHVEALLHLLHTNTRIKTLRFNGNNLPDQDVQRLRHDLDKQAQSLALRRWMQSISRSMEDDLLIQLFLTTTPVVDRSIDSVSRVEVDHLQEMEHQGPNVDEVDHLHEMEHYGPTVDEEDYLQEMEHQELDLKKEMELYQELYPERDLMDSTIDPAVPGGIRDGYYEILVADEGHPLFRSNLCCLSEPKDRRDNKSDFVCTSKGIPKDKCRWKFDRQADDGSYVIRYTSGNHKDSTLQVHNFYNSEKRSEQSVYAMVHQHGKKCRKKGRHWRIEHNGDGTYSIFLQDRLNGYALCSLYDLNKDIRDDYSFYVCVADPGINVTKWFIEPIEQ